MPRYINKQQHKASCAPVAILNAIKFKGNKISYRKSLKTFSRLGYGSSGTSISATRDMLVHFEVEHKRFEHTPPSESMRRIEEILNRKNGVLLSFRFYYKNKNKEDHGHMVFIDYHTKHYLRVYNMWKVNGTAIVSKKRFLRYFRISHKRSEYNPEYPRIFEIPK